MLLEERNSLERESLEIIREEAQLTVTAQRGAHDEIDRKAIKILRVNLVVLGVVVSIVSVAASSALEPLAGLTPTVVNGYALGGVLSLIVSTLFAALTYTMADLDIGISHENVATLIRTDFQVRETELLLCKNYALRINFNRSMLIRRIPLIQLAVVFVIIGFMSFGLGLYHGLIGPVPGLIQGSVILIVLFIGTSIGLPGQIVSAFRDWWIWRGRKYFEGIERCFQP